MPDIERMARCFSDFFRSAHVVMRDMQLTHTWLKNKRADQCKSQNREDHVERGALYHPAEIQLLKKHVEQRNHATTVEQEKVTLNDNLRRESIVRRRNLRRHFLREKRRADRKGK